MKKWKEKVKKYAMQYKAYCDVYIDLIQKKIDLTYKKLKKHFKETGNMLLLKYQASYIKYNHLIHKKSKLYSKKMQEYFSDARNRKKAISVSLIALVLFASIGFLSQSMTAYHVSFNQIPIGVVKNTNDVLGLLEEINLVVKDKYHADVIIEKDLITFDKFYSLEKEPMDKAEIMDRFTSLEELEAKAFQIVVNDVTVATLASEEVAQGILDSIKNQ